MNKSLWPFLFFFLLFSAFAFIAPFIVLYYQDLGFTGPQIGLLTGLTPLLTLFSSPLWTGLADSTRRHRLILSLNIALAVLALVVISFADIFWIILIFALTFNFFIAPVASFADSATMHTLGDQKELYGRVRLGGTIGWAIAAWTGGIIVQNFGLTASFRSSAVLFFLGLIVAQQLRFTRVQDAEAGAVKGRAVDLFRNRGWYTFMAVAFAGGLALAVVNNYLGVFMEGVGADSGQIGFAWTLGTIAEFPIFFYGDRLIRKFKPEGMLFISMVVTGLRLVLFALAHDPGTVLALQLLNGLTFPAMWMAGVAYADANSPASLSSTGQGLFNAFVWGFGSAVGGFIGGPLFEMLGGNGLFLVFGLLVLGIVLPVSLIHRRIAPARSLPVA